MGVAVGDSSVLVQGLRDLYWQGLAVILGVVVESRALVSEFGSVRFMALGLPMRARVSTSRIRMQVGTLRVGTKYTSSKASTIWTSNSQVQRVTPPLNSLTF